MELQNSFTVPADIATAWSTLLDVEAIAPCMPGATLESVNGDEFTGNSSEFIGSVLLYPCGFKMRTGLKVLCRIRTDIFA